MSGPLLLTAGAPASPPTPTPRTDSGCPEGKGLSWGSCDPAPTSARLHLTQTRRRDKGRENQGNPLRTPSPTTAHLGRSQALLGTRGQVQAWPGMPPPPRHSSRLSGSQGHLRGAEGARAPSDPGERGGRGRALNPGLLQHFLPFQRRPRAAPAHSCAPLQSVNSCFA